MPLLLNLLENTKKYGEIKKHYSPLLDNAYKEYQNAKGSNEEKSKLSNYITLLDEYEKSRQELYNEYEAQELQYFSQHLEELCEKIKSYTKDSISAIRLGQDLKDEAFKKLYPNEDTIRYVIMRELEPYLKLLSQQDKEKYKEIVKVINEVLNNSLVRKIFTKTRQGTATNKLTKFSTRKNKALMNLDPITGILKISREKFIVAINNFIKTSGLKTSTFQLLDALTETLTNSGGKSQTITIPLKEYMERRGLKDEKEARKQVKADLETLSNTTLTFTQKLKGDTTKDYLNLKLIGSHGIKNGIITVAFDQMFYSLLTGYNIMFYPKQLWEFSDTKNPNSYYFLRTISEHKNMNVGKKNEDIISVATLLSSTPYIPSYEEVVNTDRMYTRRIIDPFERDMDACDETLKWEYCHSNGMPLTNEEIEHLNYEIFSKLLVHIHWVIYPDQTERLQKVKKSKKIG